MRKEGIVFQKIEKDDSSEIVIKRGKGGKIFIWTVVVLIPLFLTWLIFISARLTQPGMWQFILLVSTIPAGIAFWYSGPHEIELNLKRKTYVAKKGFPFLARSFSGDFQDMYGLCIRKNTSKSGQVIGYRIDLDWNLPKRPPFELMRMSKLEKAQKMQKEFSRKLGIPVGEEL